MKFDKPAGENPIDQLKVVGRPHDRIDGPLKTTGTARYAYEWHEESPNAAYGYIVGSAIAKGRLTALDTDAAQKAPGVLAVITASNAGALSKGDKNTARLLGGPTIEHYHQAIALVVAETFEQARAAASLVQAHYRRNKGAYSLADEKQAVSQPPEDTPDKNVGDFDGAFTSAAVKIDATYTTPDQSHMAMEPHASMAVWDGNKLTLWASNQMIDWCRTDLAKTLKVSVENVRIISPYIGGGFGGKLFLRSDALLAALAARAVKRPVKVMLPRPTIPNNTTHRPATLQHLRIGADQSGKITAISHESWSGNLPGGTPETAVQQSELLYAGANRHTGLRLATLDLPEGNAMRAPGEAPGLMALEIAIDELAEKAGIDPVEFRILNDTQVDPADPTRRFSRRQLIECLRTGADKFGWKQRNATPGQVRDGEWLVGHGVAAGFRNNLLEKSGARVHLEPNGTVTVETDMTDIGTGDGVALYGNIFHGTSPELIGHAPPLKHREVSHAQQALTAEFFGCQLPHDRGEREIFFCEPLRWLNTFDGRKNRFIFIQGSLAGVSGQRLARRWLGATPGTPRRSSHMRHSWLNFIFRGYKKTMGRAVRKTSGHRDLTRPSPLAVGTGSYFSRSRAVFAL